MDMIAVNIPNTEEGKQKLQSYLDRGYGVYFSFPLIETDKGVRLAKVVLKKNYKPKNLEYGHYSLD